MKKRILASLMALCLIVGLLPATAMAAEEENSGELSVLADESLSLTGYCGADTSYKSQTYNCSTEYQNETKTFTGTYYSNAIWTLTENETLSNGSATAYKLTISGTGAIGDFESSWSFGRPWHYALAEVENCDVTESRDRITEIEIANGITEIGAHTFEAYGNISSIVLPNSVMKVGENAFNHCDKAISIDFGTGLKEIGATAFSDCKALTSISLPASLETIGSSAFSGCAGLTGGLVIPNSVTTIGDSAFANDEKLTEELTIGSSVTSIGKNAFANCRFSGTLTIPDSVTSIGEAAFNACQFTDISLGNGLVEIGKNAFYNSGTYSGHLSIPDSVITIGESAFSSLRFTSIHLGKSVTTIGASAFINCTSVHSLDVTSVGSTVSYDTRAFTSMANPNTIYLNSDEQKNTISNYISEGRSAFAITNGGTFAAGTSFESGKLATPTKEGSIFAGWYTKDGTSGDNVTNTTRGNTYYAKWTYSITFDGNGATGGSMTAQQVTEGDTSTTLTANTFTKTGYAFDGWNTAKDGSGDSYTDQATAPTTSTTLYAQWTPNTYTIQFSGGDGASGSTASVTATYDQPVTLTPNGFTMAGKNFAGWATSQEKANAGTVEYSDQTDVKNLAASGTVTLYAVWTDKQVLDPDLTDTVVTYNGQPQKFHVDGTYTVKYSQNRVEVTAPTNAGVYDVEISRAEDDTYAAYHGRVVGGLVINKAPLTIKADDQSIRVGSTLPEYTYTVIGWQGNDTDDLLSGVTATCPTADANKAGDYTITVSGPAAIDNYTISYVDGTLTVSRRSSGGGGGGSSSSSTTTETEKNPDGSTTTTVTDKKTGTVTETTKFKDGSTLVVETKKDGTVTTTETAKNGVKVRTMDEPGEDVTATVTIPRSVGEAVVTIPADVDYGMVAVDADTGEIVKLSVPTEDGMTVKLDGSAELVLVERSLDFTDTNNHWAEDAIDFATAHELFAGTSDTTFSPDSSMTRAMLMTVLARFDGQDTTGGAVWYEKAMAWAKENGISDGSNPDGNITREQFATMLWRYAGSPAGDGTLSSFGDSASVNGYAVDAMRWAVSTGIISGMSDGTLAPQSSATRAQVATMLMRFVENLTK